MERRIKMNNNDSTPLQTHILSRISRVYPLSGLPVILATTNPIKLERLKVFLDLYGFENGCNFEIETLDSINATDFDCPEIYYNYSDNSKLKNDMLYYMITEGGTSFEYRDGDYLIITTDNGLEIPKLHGWPGVHTKRANSYKYRGEAGKNETSAEAILEQASDLNESDRNGSMHCACAISLVFFESSGSIYPNNKHVFIGQGSQKVQIIYPSSNEKVYTAWDICAPRHDLNSDKILPVHSKISIEKSMIYGDFMYQAFSEAMDRAMVRYMELRS